MTTFSKKEIQSLHGELSAWHESLANCLTGPLGALVENQVKAALASRKPNAMRTALWTLRELNDLRVKAEPRDRAGEPEGVDYEPDMEGLNPHEMTALEIAEAIADLTKLARRLANGICNARLREPFARDLARAIVQNNGDARITVEPRCGHVRVELMFQGGRPVVFYDSQTMDISDLGDGTAIEERIPF